MKSGELATIAGGLADWFESKEISLQDVTTIIRIVKDPSLVKLSEEFKEKVEKLSPEDLVTISSILQTIMQANVRQIQNQQRKQPDK